VNAVMTFRFIKCWEIRDCTIGGLSSSAQVHNQLVSGTITKKHMYILRILSNSFSKHY
jgi:hypothetical protein